MFFLKFLMKSSPFFTPFLKNRPMIPIAFTFVTTALWLILTPWSLKTTLLVTTIIFIVVACIAFYSLLKSKHLYTTTSFFVLIGMILSILLYLPTLKNYQIIALNIPKTISATFQIERNQYPTSTTIKIISAEPSNESDKTPDSFYKALPHSSLRVYNIHSDIKSTLIEGEIYQGVVSIRPRFFRNIPGDQQRIYQALARKEIGYGKFEGPLEKISPESFIEQFRKKTANNFVKNFQHGNYLSALSVGITNYLATEDWNILRQTGTIHLVSISGLHLSLTAFYAFVIFKMSAGLLAIRRISPYKIAAFLSILVAWSYASIAGLSLPTVRAAIMFSIAMFALLINRPILSLHGVSIALIIILAHNPLSILMPGFWLSFIAVIILILSARIFSTPLKALLLTQLVISLMLTPLTASFFGEVSLISPLINLFAIPWTSLMIMPPLLLGTLFLNIHQPTAHLFIAIADQSIDVLTRSIQWGARMPYASIKTYQIPLIIAITSTTCILLILYFIPKIPLLRADHPLTFSKISQFYRRIFLELKRFMILILCILLCIIGVYIKSLLQYKDTVTETSKMAQTEVIHLYLLPVGEGLSLLFQSSELTFLFDTGNRFMRYDAGQQIILPTLQHLNIQSLDQIFLSFQNQQHIGGTRSIRTQLPKTAITAHPDLLWLISSAQDCQQYHYQSDIIHIQPISRIKSSCAFHITLFETISLYLLSDITEQEWRDFSNEKVRSREKELTHQILLFPNQGRRFFPLNQFIKTPHLFTTLLFSTKKPSSKLTEKLHNFPTVEYFNAYYGTIHLTISTKNAKSFSKLHIKDYSDQARYWWLKP